MKIFYGSTFIEKKKLEEEGIKDQIKLEYYKIINEDEIVKGNKSKFGIEVVKTKYSENNNKIEKELIKYLSNDEGRVDEILSIFKKNAVTPINVQDVLSDMSKKFIVFL